MPFDPLKLQTRLIEILDSAADKSLSASEARGELEDLGEKLDLHEVRAGLEQLIALRRAHKPRTAPGAPVVYQLMSVDSAATSPTAPAPAKGDSGASADHQRLLDVLGTKPHRNVEIEQALGLSPSRVCALTRALKDEGAIEREAASQRSAWRIKGAEIPVSRETMPPPPAAEAEPGPRARTVTPRAKASPRATKAKAKPRNGKAPGNLRGAFSELRGWISAAQCGPTEARVIRDLARKVQTLDQLADLVPAPIARVLAEIRQDLQSA